MSYAIKVKPGHEVHLHDIDPEQDGGLDKKAGQKRLEELGTELADLQTLLFAAGQRSVLIVLQGRDTSGKDGTIGHVFSRVNPQGCRVESFKVPTQEELAHDFLWRCHKVTPARGTMTIFNRSHYEDVLVARVHSLVPKARWHKRYDEINHWEHLLANNDTIILKFYLHISQEEQEQRLLDREQDTAKAWKLSVGDWQERAYWDDYTAAYEDALAKCSTDAAPWYIVPANRKWYRNLAVAETVVEALRPYRDDWMSALKVVGEQAHRELADYRAGLKQS